MIERILITVKTYPHPSERYQELVCTAGMRADGTFVRLYPVDFRYLPIEKWYKKYQWIEVELSKNSNDPRPESYRPITDSITLIGEPLNTANNWAERKKIVLAQPIHTMCELQALNKQDLTSLGIIKPYSVNGIKVEQISPEWDVKHHYALSQLSLFDQKKKPLKKIPFRFSYQFMCCENCSGHEMSITDWELGVLYFKEEKRLGSEIEASRSVQRKYFDELCSIDKDAYFYVGTTYKVYNSWIVLGVFYPNKGLTTHKAIQQNLDFGNSENE